MGPLRRKVKSGDGVEYGSVPRQMQGERCVIVFGSASQPEELGFECPFGVYEELGSLGTRPQAGRIPNLLMTGPAGGVLLDFFHLRYSSSHLIPRAWD